MQTLAATNTTSAAMRLRQLGLAGIAIALLAAACTDDAIVYPNRNLRPAAGESSSEAGEATGGSPSGGAPSGGSGGAKAGSGGSPSDAGEQGADAGAAPTGPVCGNGQIEPPEQCDDGNVISGDGCSADCQSSCEKCEKNVCPLWDISSATGITSSAYEDCYRAVGKITKGPATGYSRAEVCRELVDCIRQEGCGQSKNVVVRFESCWCDVNWVDNTRAAQSCITLPDPATPNDPTKFIPGKCASLFQDGSEGDSLSDVIAQLSATLRAEGQALRLLRSCDSRACTEECVPAYFGREGIATITADLSLIPNNAGESALGDLIADAERSAGNADFAFSRDAVATDTPDLTVAATPNRDADAPGRVLWSEAATIKWGLSGLYGNHSAESQVEANLYKLTMTGQQIYDALAQQPTQSWLLSVSGLSYTYDAAAPASSRIVDVRKSGVSISKTDSFSVAVSDYLISRDSPIPLFSQIPSPVLLPGVSIPNLLGEYLGQLPQPVSPPELRRVTRLN